MLHVNYLVTGGSGYIGTHLVRHLVRSGANVVSLDLKNAPGLIGKRISQIQGDCLEFDLLQTLHNRNKFDVIVNLAANKSVRESTNSRSSYFKTNVEAAVNLAKFSTLNNIPVFIHASSAAVYGNQQDGKITELNLVNPQNYYGETKMISEVEISKILQNSSTGFTSLRFFNVGGYDSEFIVDKLDINILPQIAFSLKNTKLFNLYGNNFNTVDGSCERDFVHVLDVVETIESIAKFILSKRLVATEYNVCTGVKTSMLSLIARMEMHSRTKLMTEIHPKSPEDPDSIVGDRARLNDLLGRSTYRAIEEITKSTWNAFDSKRFLLL